MDKQRAIMNTTYHCVSSPIGVLLTISRRSSRTVFSESPSDYPQKTELENRRRTYLTRVPVYEVKIIIMVTTTTKTTPVTMAFAESKTAPTCAVTTTFRDRRRSRRRRRRQQKRGPVLPYAAGAPTRRGLNGACRRSRCRGRDSRGGGGATRAAATGRRGVSSSRPDGRTAAAADVPVGLARPGRDTPSDTRGDRRRRSSGEGSDENQRAGTVTPFTARGGNCRVRLPVVDDARTFQRARPTDFPGTTTATTTTWFSAGAPITTDGGVATCLDLDGCGVTTMWSRRDCRSLSVSETRGQRPPWRRTRRYIPLRLGGGGGGGRTKCIGLTRRVIQSVFV